MKHVVRLADLFTAFGINVGYRQHEDALIAHVGELALEDAGLHEHVFSELVLWGLGDSIAALSFGDASTLVLPQLGKRDGFQQSLVAGL